MSTKRSIAVLATLLALAASSCYRTSGGGGGEGPRNVDEDAGSADDATSDDSVDAGSFRLDDPGDVAGAPEIDVVDRLKFRPPEPRSDRTQTVEFTVSNVGEGPLVVTDLDIENFGETAVFRRSGEWPETMRLLPGESQTLGVDFEPVNVQEQKGRILIETNDPRYRDGTVPIALHAPAGPCLKPEQEEYYFPVTQTSSDEPVEKTVTLENCGPSAVTVDRVELNGNYRPFEVEERAAETPYEIAAGETFEFKVTAYGADSEDFTAKAFLEVIYNSETGGRSFTVELFAE